jgi:hypothetical protein
MSTAKLRGCIPLWHDFWTTIRHCPSYELEPSLYKLLVKVETRLKNLGLLRSVTHGREYAFFATAPQVTKFFKIPNISLDALTDENKMGIEF